ncbi:MAG: aminotransferase class III-fold pyridoxal phosphate-dependent enzyme [Deltaproteobacteria bacterium]|nr:aminotransferase class III-fold pyridoxal phosphate-dependent enzyme [Deltaproteobacteria bacterium]
MSLEPDGLPAIVSEIPGPRSRALVDRLALFECPAITARRARRAEASGTNEDPIVWARARGSVVEDADGNRFVDLTAGFGVASVGHRHPRVVEAIVRQSERLVHALGDVHPSDAKIALLERIADVLGPPAGPPADVQTILGISGADAVEAALKTAMIATGRPGVVAFEGGYHGLSHGPLAACGYTATFRDPFRAQLNPHVRFVPFASRDDEVARSLDVLDAALGPGDVGLVLVEPIQARGGIRVPPAGWLRAVASRARAAGALLALDEIFTGLGRTGAMLASSEEVASPDLVLLGKALGGCMPLSACVGTSACLASWGTSRGEAIHTSTFLGQPLACAAARAALDVIVDEKLALRASVEGRWLLDALAQIARRHGLGAPHGRGLLVGLPMGAAARTLRTLRALLRRGFLALPAGADTSVLAVHPPLTIARAQLEAFVDALDHAIQDAPA